MRKLCEVKKLFETVPTSRYDFTIRDRKFKCYIDACAQGVHIRYITKEKLKNKLPPPLAAMMGDPEQEVDDVVIERQVSVAWWQKTLGVSLERKTRWELAKIQRMVKRKTKIFLEAEQVKNSLGV